MFYIGICDDEEVHREHIKELCCKYFEGQGAEYECIAFTSGEELLQYKEHKLHLLFLDIELGDMSGVEMLSRLEEEDTVWRVVFVSSHDEMVFETFGIKTLGFERKPAQYEKIAKWLSIAIKENSKNTVYEYYMNGETFYFKLEELFYMEGEGSYTYLNFKKERHLVSGRLKCWEDKMEAAPMVRIHKSYLVNMLHVKKWEGDKVLLINGVELTQGRQYRKTAKESYLRFIRDMARGRM